MFVKKIEAEKRYLAELAQAVAFECDFDLEKVREQAETAKEDKNSDVWCALSEDERVVYGCLVNGGYDCAFDGAQVKLGGVGSVATLPQYRRGGVIRECFKAALNDMFSRGFEFSFLYPFSTEYYRKFGYETGAELDEWTVEFSALRACGACEGEIRQLFPGDDMSVLLKIYDEFYRDFNLKVKREKYDEALEKENLLNQQRYIYVWYDRENRPHGFFIGKKITENGVAVMDCTNTFRLRNAFYFADAEALSAMLGFIKSAFSADYKKIRFAVPAAVPVQSFVGENNAAECKKLHNGMLRAVNAEKALSLCRCKGSGEIKVAVADAMISENNATWKLVYREGKPNTVTKTCEKADVSMDINSFSALILGARGWEEAEWMPDVVVANKDARMQDVFYRKKCFMPNLF